MIGRLKNVMKKQNSPISSLYDFLYLDRFRLETLYLLSLSKEGIPREIISKLSEIENSGTETQLKGNAKIPAILGAEGHINAHSGNVFERGEEIRYELHLIPVLQSLHYLVNILNGKNYDSVQENHLFLEEGQIVFLTKELFLEPIKLYSKMLSPQGSILRNIFGIEDIDKLSKKERNQLKEIMSFLLKALTNLPFDIMCILKTPNNLIIGSVKEDFLTEHIGSLILRRCGNPFKVKVIGIKEEINLPSNFSLPEYLHADLEYINKLITAVFSVSGGFTPIAIYRDIF